ncbi:MAG: cytochrome b [Parasphingopyxis sp.]|nr:cytochrome b [Sphingomonadales bacterium]
MSSAAAERYARVAILLHWLIAALVVANLTIGLLHEDMARDARQFWMAQHFAIGLSVLSLSVIRLGWRIGHGFPPLSLEHAAWERILARFTHLTFYLLMIGVPLLGWLIVSTGGGNPVSIFGLFEIPALPIGENDSVHDFAEEAHELLAKAWIGIIALHVVGALKHQLIDRDETLARMIPLLRTQRK